MNLQKRIYLIDLLRDYLEKNEEDWKIAKTVATSKNPWFTEHFIQLATENIIDNFLKKEKIEKWVHHYYLNDSITPKNIGIVMAGNIPMVGFHDFLCVFISGHKQTIKFSSKDDVLLNHLILKLNEFDKEVSDFIQTSEMLKGCDAYIATGGNQSAIHFEQYFNKYPNIIRRNRTSVAVLTGKETVGELELLSTDIHTYFGLGCRNVTKLFVPKTYDFIPLLHSFSAFKYFRDYHKYSNNYDYQLSILLLNNIKYMSNESTLLIEDERLYSPISVLHYEHYENNIQLTEQLKNNNQIQCIVGRDYLPFGKSQEPDIFTYADGVDTMQFLLSL
jgi:hypothetical protein